MKKKDNTLILMLGGNMGDIKDNFNKAILKLEENVGKLEIKSALYNSEPWGYSNQNYFLNQALLFSTSCSINQVFQETQKIEEELGKSKNRTNGPRTLDIDIMFYNQVVYNSLDLIIPHPRLHLRKFNLVPLNEIVPEYIHPLLKKTISEILLESKDPLNVIITN